MLLILPVPKQNLAKVKPLPLTLLETSGGVTTLSVSLDLKCIEKNTKDLTGVYIGVAVGVACLFAIIGCIWIVHRRNHEAAVAKKLAITNSQMAE